MTLSEEVVVTMTEGVGGDHECRGWGGGDYNVTSTKT